MLALFLDHYGVRSVLFNSEPEVRRHPKGSTHNSRTMEHHRRLGIAQTIRDLSLPLDRPTDVSYYTRLTGWELGRIRMPSEADKRRAVANSAATDQIPEPLLRANQMYVEAFLLEHARSAPEHHGPLRLAGRQVRGRRRRRHGRGRSRPAAARGKPGARNISSAATAAAASCAARWRCATTASPSSTRRTTAAA